MDEFFDDFVIIFYANGFIDVLASFNHHCNGQCIKVGIDSKVRYVFHGLLLLIGFCFQVLYHTWEQPVSYNLMNKGSRHAYPLVAQLQL